MKRCCLFVLVIAWGLSAQDDRMVALKGNVHPYAKPQYDAGPLDPSKELHLITVMLKLPDDKQAALDKLLAEQQDPRSPNYHNWLTPEEYADRFGCSKSDIDKIAAWLKSAGLAIDDIGRGRNWIVVSGSVARVEAAFHTQIRQYRVEDELHFANSTEPSVPATIRPFVLSINGLDDFHPKPARGKRKPVPLAPPSPQNPTKPDFTSGSFHYLAPDDLATIYGITLLYQAGFDGTGQSMVVAGQTTINSTDIPQFRSTYGLSNRPPVLMLVPGSVAPGNADLDEANLDLEWSGAVARNATIYYVYSTNVFTSVQYAVSQNIAPVISFSYGACELANSSTGSASIQQVAQQANSQGITWLASSGDAGAAGCDPQGQNPLAQKGMSVNVPADVPEVTGVGGTMFNEGNGSYWTPTNTSTGASALGYIPETAWNESSATIGLLASGGGYSTFFTRPTWQTGSGINFTARGVPDVSMTAAGHDGYRTVINGQTFISSGTSAATPVFAGLVVLLNQYQVAKGFQAKAGQGNINPNLYKLAAIQGIFNDITSGNNIVPCATGTPNCTNGSYGYSAGAGYDVVTGLGSVNANNLITRWNSQVLGTTTTVTANPTSLALSASTQVTAAVKPSGSSGNVDGTVAFNLGTVTLGSATLVNSAATITVYGSQLASGSDTITVTYSGSASYAPSSGSVTVTVAVPTGNSAIVPSVTPNPVYQQAADADGYSWFFTVQLSEKAGVPTTLTTFSLNGTDYSSSITAFFGNASIPALGSIQAPLRLKLTSTPATEVFGFGGVDGSGQKWTQQISVIFYGQQISASMALAGAPSTVRQNPRAASNCQWSQNLTLQEQNGHAVTISKFLAGAGTQTFDLSTMILGFFGSNQLPAFGALQSGVCWQGISVPEAVSYEVDGTDENGFAVSATLSGTFQGAATSPGTLSVGKASLFLADSGSPASTTQTVNLTAGQQWTVAVLPNNRATSWLSVYPLSGTGSGSVTVTATHLPSQASQLANGLYAATLVFQSLNTIPQFVNVPVTFSVSTAGCGFSLGSNSIQIGAAGGGQQSVALNTSNGCTWNVLNNNYWITVPSNSGGTGSGTVTYSVQPNTGSARIGSFSAGGATFEIVQAAGIAGEPQANYYLPSTGVCSSSFYVTTANLVSGANEGVYSLIVSINNGLLAGGFNLGGGFAANGASPGFGQFKTPASIPVGPVTVTVNAQNLPGFPGTIGLQVTMYQETSNGRVQVQTATGGSSLNFTVQNLLPGTYYTTVITSLAGSPRGTFQMQLIAPQSGFEGGVVVGGYAIQGVAGYGGYCVPSSQNINMVVQGKSTFGASAAGAIVLNVQNAAGKVIY
jgi:hypothetical protein